MPAPILRLATPADDARLRRLLRDNPMPGSISLGYEREPDYFLAAGLDGALSQTIVSIDSATDEWLGMGTRIVRQMYLDGQVQDVGYMSHLRVDGRRAWGLSLARQLMRAFGEFHRLHADGRAPFYLMSVIAGNAPARRILTADLPGMPFSREYCRMFTYAISPHRLKSELPLPGGLELRRGAPEHLPEIVACLQRNGQRRQFAPYWSNENLFSASQTPNLQPQDFFVAVRGSRVAGCLALWDQTPFKQMVVRGYTGSLAYLRPIINSLSRHVDVPNLPPIDTQLCYGYASHLAVDNDDREVFLALVRAVYNETKRRGLVGFMLGLSEMDPLRPLLTKNYWHIPYLSQIYLMSWQDGLAAVKQVDARLPGLEISVL